MQDILNNYWPLWFVCLAMIVAAVIDGWKLKVPNWLTLPLILSGWALGLCHTLGWYPDPGEGTLGSSLLCTALGFILLGGFWAIGAMGAGDVKMQMGFGAWLGAFYKGTTGAEILLYAFVVAVLIGGVIGGVMMLIFRDRRKSLSNALALVSDLFGGGVSKAARNAAERKPTQHLLPYGIPLCLGFISYLIYHYATRG
jgi:prepilin peptidase CpaA